MSITILTDRKTLEAFKAKLPGEEFTVRDFDWSKVQSDMAHVRDDVLVTFAVGRVLSLREMNGYDDSDFYATYITPQGFRTEYQYATTRGWTYANNATVDATEEARAISARLDRRLTIQNKWRNRKAKRALRAACGLSLGQYNRLVRAYHGGALEAILGLLSSKKLRSEFKKSLAKQVRDWLADETPKFRTPLSAKQLGYLH